MKDCNSAALFPPRYFSWEKMKAYLILKIQLQTFIINIFLILRQESSKLN